MEEHFEWVKDVPETVTITKDEYDYLVWFRQNSTFGIDVDSYVHEMNDEYMSEGKLVPAEYL